MNRLVSRLGRLPLKYKVIVVFLLIALVLPASLALAAGPGTTDVLQACPPNSNNPNCPSGDDDDDDDVVGDDDDDDDDIFQDDDDDDDTGDDDDDDGPGQSNVCPHGGGWEKFEPLSGLEFEYPNEIPDGCSIQNCYKAGNNVAFGEGPTVVSEFLNNPGNAYLELSHASFLLECNGDDDDDDIVGDDDDDDDVGDDDDDDDDPEETVFFSVAETVLPVLGPVEAVAPAAGGVSPSPVAFGGIGLGLLGLLRLAWALIKRS